MALATGAAYLTGARIADRFYGSFGVSPHDVGYGTQDYVTVAVTLLLLATFFSVDGVLVGIYANAVKLQLKREKRDREIIVGGCLFSVVFAGLGFFLVTKVDTSFQLAAGLGAGFSFGAAFGTEGAVSQDHAGELPVAQRTPIDVARAAVPVIVVGIILFYLAFGDLTQVATQAKRTGHGQPTALSVGHHLRPSSLVSVGANPASSLAGRCVLHLGGTDRTIVVWVPPSGATPGSVHVLDAAGVDIVSGCRYRGR